MMSSRESAQSNFFTIQPDQQACYEVNWSARTLGTRWCSIYFLSEMPSRCVAANCGNKSDLKKGDCIARNTIPQKR